jgi:adenylylsulfate kinase-like enzyme
MIERSEVIFIGGRSGTGKSSAASALHELLCVQQVKHVVIEGDYLELAGTVIVVMCIRVDMSRT